MKKWTAINLGRYGNKERIKAMARGVVETGGEVSHCVHSDVKTLAEICARKDVAFAYTCGMHWPERAAREWLAANSIPLVVLDLGYFKRAKGSNDSLGYNQVGIGKIGWVPAHDVDSSRWDALDMPSARSQLGDRPKNILVLGQVPNDSQHNMTEKKLNAWFDSKTAQFRADGYTITFRPHPCHARGKPPICDRVSSPALCSLAQAIDEASHVITFNSTAGLESILAGVPVVCDPSAHYAAISGYGAGECTRADVMLHMHRLAWSQWTCAEIASGEPIRFLFPSVVRPRTPMKHLIAIPFFGKNPKYLEMLHVWVAQLKRTAPDAEFVIFTHDAQSLLKPFVYPIITLSIGKYDDVIRPGQPFDIKGALMCEAALAIDRPFLMLDSDALLVDNPSAALDRLGDTPCAMPIDLGAIVNGYPALCGEPFPEVRKMCAGVFYFGDVTRRAALVGHYRMAWREMFHHEMPWTPHAPHLLEQYAWSLAHHRMAGATLPATFNWPSHIVGESPYSVVNHLFGRKKWNGKAPANT